MILKKFVEIWMFIGLNQLLIANKMSTIFFMKYLPPVRPRMIPKLQNCQNLLKFGNLTFEVCLSLF